MKEERSFAVNPAILYSVILSQAGTLAKALLEGVMNSVDAGATRVNVTLDSTTFQLKDDGRGFRSKEEIVSWFETFGTPHQEGDATYGRFRMGRGQMMAFAVNEWRTGRFRMEVDIRGKQSLGYTLTENLAPVKGCAVTGKLYQTLSSEELAETVTALTGLVRYISIPVVLNGKRVSKSVADESWDLETADAWFKFRSKGPLEVYNLGAKVRDYEAYDYGASGVVVSKQPLEVNFARNDILTHSCMRWRRIVQTLRQVNFDRLAGRSALSDDERTFLARQVLSGMRSRTVDVLDLKLLTDVNGRHHSIRELGEWQRVTVTSHGKGRVASQVQRLGKALVLSEATLQRFRTYSLESMLSTLRNRFEDVVTAEETPLKDLAMSAEVFKTVESAALEPLEQAAFDAVVAIHGEFHDWYAKLEKGSGPRSLTAGESNVADAWTDGKHWIALNRRLLRRAADRGLGGFLEVMVTLVHEYCHDVSDMESHDHDMVFYNKHHDVVQYQSHKLLAFATKAHRRFAKATAKAARKAKAPQAKASASPALRPAPEGTSGAIEHGGAVLHRTAAPANNQGSLF